MPLIPENIRLELQAAQKISDNLAQIASISRCNHKFTLDGRFVGDVGEVLVAQYFDIDPHQKQRHRHDASCVIGDKNYGVQIKCRRESTVIDFYSQPELLLVIEIDKRWEKWDVVYNGSGDFLTQGDNYTIDGKGRLWRGQTKGRRIYLKELRKLAEQLSSIQVPKRGVNF